jgi:endonuclease-3
MNIQEKVKIIQKILNSTFPHPKPFLHAKNPYTLLIAVLLSAQCTDDRINKLTPTLFKKASTPKAMLKISQKELEKMIYGAGFYHNKAKAILGLSKVLVQKFHGKVPSNFEDLESLPGVGHKTASVVMSQAFKKPAFPVDTHVYRLARRWKLSSSNNVKKVEEDLKKLFKLSSWRKVHLQMVSFGKKYCTAKKHSNHTCPICSEIL